jgi:hypothetical protein
LCEFYFSWPNVEGDPVGLIEGMGESVVQFFRKTGQVPAFKEFRNRVNGMRPLNSLFCKELSGKTPLRGEGVKALVQACNTKAQVLEKL